MSEPFSALSAKLRFERLNRVSRLRDETFKRFFNDVADGHSVMFADRYRYEKGTDELHLHFEAIRPFCLFLRADVNVDGRIEAVCDHFDPKRAAFWSEFSMLVWIGDRSENLRPIASVARLQALNSCDMCWANADKSTLYASRKFLWSVINRELSVLLDHPRITQREFKNKIIEGCPEIVDALSNEDTEERRKFDLARGMEYVNVIRRLRVEMNDRTLKVVLPEKFDLPLQLSKVFFCPLDPLKGAVEWMD